jgi:primosomal protein N' (replication factor Y)
MPTRVAQVLLDSPLPQLDHLFDYAIPTSLATSVVIGCRVRVPLRMGNRRVDAFVVNIVDESSFGGTLQEIDSVISSVAVLPHGLYSLARQVADRQAGSASDVLRLAIPPRFVRAEKAFFSDEAVARRLSNRAEFARSTAVAEALSRVSEKRDDLRAPFAGFADGTCRSIVVPPGSTEVDEKHVPTWALMFAAEAALTLQRGESTICVVPAFRDIDDLLLGLAALEVGDVAIRLDSRQTGGERYAGYLRILEENPVIVVGNRSAVYAPVHRPGLFLLWDDGDPVLQEPMAPYAHPRDVALLESKNSGARLVFAGFTVSVEVQRLVELKFASAWTAPRSAYSKVVPTDSLTNEQSRARIPSAAWAHAREQSLIGPVLVQVARAGYAPSVCCAGCRTRAVCAACSGPLATGSSASLPSCRWCGLIAGQWRCLECDGTKLRLMSSGSERTAEELGRAFPNTRIILSDGAHTVTRVTDTPCVVVATPGAEPLAENGYRSVVVLDGESHRSRAGLRVDEHAVRSWIAALALARADATCFLVGAGHELGATIASWRIREFAQAQLAQRRALGLPPTRRTATLTGFHTDVVAALERVSTLGQTKVMGPSSTGEQSRAILFFDYRDGDAITAALRASIVVAATKGTRRRTATSQPERIVRLRARLDDAELEDSP